MIEKYSALALCIAALALLAVTAPASAADANGCHMEKQCKWVNFQKVCVWVKVCR